MSTWADDDGGLPPLKDMPVVAPPSASAAPSSTTNATTNATTTNATVKSGYVPPHLRNRPAAAASSGGGFGTYARVRDCDARELVNWEYYARVRARVGGRGGGDDRRPTTDDDEGGGGGVWIARRKPFMDGCGLDDDE